MKTKKSEIKAKEKKTASECLSLFLRYVENIKKIQLFNLGYNLY